MTAAERPPDPYRAGAGAGCAAVARRCSRQPALPLGDLTGSCTRQAVRSARRRGRWGRPPLDDQDLTEFGIDGFHRTGDDVIASVPMIVDSMVLSHVLAPSEQQRSCSTSASTSA